MVLHEQSFNWSNIIEAVVTEVLFDNDAFPAATSTGDINRLATIPPFLRRVAP